MVLVPALYTSRRINEEMLIQSTLHPLPKETQLAELTMQYFQQHNVNACCVTYAVRFHILLVERTGRSISDRIISSRTFSIHHVSRP